MSKNLSDIFPPTEIGGGGGGGVEEAPLTGKMYARKSGAWEEFATGNLDDGNKDGEILTWDSATANWTHDDTLVVKGGNVGIGTDSPSQALEVKRNGSSFVKISSETAAGCYLHTSNALHGHYVGTKNNGDWQVYDVNDSASRMTINSSGDATFSGTVNAGQASLGNGSALSANGVMLKNTTGDAGFLLTNTGDQFVPIRDDAINFGTSGRAWKNATFSGTMYSKKIEVDNGAEGTVANFYGSADGKTRPLSISSGTANGLSGAEWKFNIASGAGNFVFSNLNGELARISNSGTIDAAAVASTASGWTAQLRYGNELNFSRGGINYIRANTAGGSIIFETNGSQIAQFRGDGKATFSGTVDAPTVACTNVWRANVCGIGFTATGGGQAYIAPSLGAPGNADGQVDFGATNTKFKNAYFSGTVDAAGFTVNGVPIGGGASGNFVSLDATANQTMKGTLTGPDFIATSDERLKDNITTAPVGLIDSLKGREWDWKESGEKGSGVVAQELEQVLPHLVHTDDEGMKSVAYNGLVAYLIEELKDCRQRIAELEAKA